MEMNDFDKFVKENMQDFKVAPSEGIKKALFAKLFFKNLLLFHKVKLILGVALLGTGTIVGVNLMNNEKANLVEKEIVLNEILTNSTDENITHVTSTDYDFKNEISTDEIATLSVNSNTNNTATNNPKGIVTKESNDIVASSNMSQENTSNKQISTNESHKISSETKNASLDNQPSKNITHKAANTESNSTNKDNLSLNSSPEENNEEISSSRSKENDNYLEKINIPTPSIETEKLISCSQPDLSSVTYNDDYAKDDAKKGFSFDIYINPYGKGKIDNILDSYYTKYWWDFYKDYNYVKTGIAAGANVNYEWKGIKLGSGINLSTLFDYRADYKYYYDNTLIPYGGDAISGVDIYGQDTALIFFVDPSDKKTINELKSDFNKYTYINVPITLGYELNTRFASLELNGGIEYGRLAAAKGIAIFKGEIDENPFPQGFVEETFTAYYYRNKYMETIDRKSSMLQRNTLGYIANAILRIHLTSRLDLFTSVKYKQSINGIYHDNYMLQKQYNSFGLNIGATYHLNERIKTQTVKFD